MAQERVLHLAKLFVGTEVAAKNPIPDVGSSASDEMSADEGSPKRTIASPMATAQGGSCRLGVLLSGGGTTLQNLIDKIDAGALPAKVALVLSSKQGVVGLQRAEKHGIPTKVVESKDYRGEDKKTDWAAMP